MLFLSSQYRKLKRSCPSNQQKYMTSARRSYIKVLWQVLYYKTSMLMKNLFLKGDVELYPGPSNTKVDVKKPVTNIQSKNHWTPIFGKYEKTLSNNSKKVLCNHCKSSIHLKWSLLRKKVDYWVCHTCAVKELPFSNEFFIKLMWPSCKVKKIKAHGLN